MSAPAAPEAQISGTLGTFLTPHHETRSACEKFDKLFVAYVTFGCAEIDSNELDSVEKPGKLGHLSMQHETEAGNGRRALQFAFTRARWM